MYNVMLKDADDAEILAEVEDRNLDVGNRALFYCDSLDLIAELLSRGVWLTLDAEVTDLAEVIRQRINQRMEIGDLTNRLIETITGRIVCK